MTTTRRFITSPPRPRRSEVCVEIDTGRNGCIGVVRRVSGEVLYRVSDRSASLAARLVDIWISRNTEADP